MAGTGMALRRGTNHGPSEAGDDVQSSIELLDRVLSEFDDMENANQVQNQIVGPTPVPLSTNNISTNTTPGNVSSTPEDESPSLGGHQSEDDGYMSMNGRKARFALSFRPLTEVTVHQENIMEQGVNVNTSVNTEDFPPPPEEAERLIATLLPRVSTTNLSKRNNSRRSRVHHGGQPAIEVLERNIRTADIDHFSNGKIIPIHTATQTTFPKTRHQRPYGWENQDQSNFRLHPAPVPPGQRYGSLPISHGIPPILSPQRMPMRTPPRTVPTSAERHREVRRRESEDNLSSDVDDVETGAVRPSEDLADDERFSDDSLEEMLLPPPPPPVPNKRESIAWEVSLDNEEELLTPGSTKVVGRRRRRSGEHSHSSTSSIPNRLKDLDDWPEPPPCSTEDEVVSPFSDSDDPIILPEELRTTDLNGSGTYIIRRGRSRKPVPNISDSNNSNSSLNSRLSSDLSLLQSRLNTPNSRYSIDLSTPHSRLSQELISPKSRCSLDLNKLSEELISPSKINVDFSPRYNAPQCRSSDFKKHSTTFDNIKSFMRESIVTRYDPCNEVTTDFSTSSPTIVRVVSLPTLSGDEYTPSRRELTVTVEEEEDVESPRQNSAEISPLRKIEKNISQLLEREDIDISSLDLNNKTHNNTHLNSPNAQIRASKRNGIQKSESAKEMLLSHLERPERPLPNSTSADFPVKVDIVQHEFPPLPPSPVVEDDDEYSEILHSVHVKKRADTLPVMPVPDTHHRSDEPPAVPPHRGESFNNSLKTRSMDGGIGRGKRNNILSSSSRMSSSERRTLPTDLPGTKRRTFNSKRSCQSPREESHMQTSCSLPETPIFARGCDIPRTPHRRAPEVPPHRTTPRQTATMSNLNSLPTGSSYRRGFSNSNLEQALVGAEMLRLAGGPGRGWYPRHRQPRPASIEHLDRLTPSHSTWDAGSRKPLTLPPNLTPKFFHRSPREALRRVTSLLIRKGNNGKEPKKEKEQQATNNWANQEEGQKKKGFFKNLWKRSRHYSLEQQ